MTNRISNLTGLLDTDSLVTASMKPYKLKVDTSKQNEQTIEWKQQQYKAIMKTSNDLYTKYLTSDGASSLISPSAYNAVKFTSTSDSIVSATTSSGASVDNYSISVSQLAAKASTTIKTSDLSNSDQLTFTFGTAAPIQIATVDGTGAAKTNAQIVSDLNAQLTAKGIAATAKNSDFTGGILLESTNMGDDVSFSAQLTKGVAPAQTTIFDSKTIKGKNLHAIITKADGTPYNISDTVNETNSNVKTIDGVTFNFKDTTGATEDASKNTVAASGTPVKLTGSKDVTALKDKIVAFVNDYNNLMASINTKIYETRDKSYTPLTDDQRKAMSADQITAWETKAKTGLLRSDDNLENLAASMKSAMSGIFGSGIISSSKLTLEDIGIKPVADYKELNGTYTIDTDKLTKALQDNFDGVKDLFVKDAASTDVSNSGVIPKLEKVLLDNVKKSDSVFNKIAGDDSGVSALTNDLTKQITEMKKKIALMETDLTDREDKLYAKYSKVESALSKMQSQQTSLSSYLGNSSN